MSKKDVLNNNEQKEQDTKETKLNQSNSEQSVVENNDDFTNDGVIDLNLYNHIASTLFNSLSNPIVRNEIKVNENILKYTELQISNLFFLESVLSKKLTNKKLAKEFLQLTANITDLALTVNKSQKKTALEILEDSNLLVVTIINSCKGVERESLERLQTVSLASFKNINDQISALSNFNTNHETEIEQSNHESENNLNQDNQSNNGQQQPPVTPNMRNFNNNDMANLSKLGVLPQPPGANPNFYPFLTKPKAVPILKQILSGILIASVLFIVITIIISTFVKGQLVIANDADPVKFNLSKASGWLVSIMTIILYLGFAFSFLKRPRGQQDKYHLSYFMLGLLLFWLIVNVSDSFYQTSDKYYHSYFETRLQKDQTLNSTVVADMKNLPNFILFYVFSIISSTISILALFIVVALMFINPRVDRNKVIRANSEYQNAINAALNGQKYDMDQSLFDKEEVNEPKSKKKSRKKAEITGRF